MRKIMIATILSSGMLFAGSGAALAAAPDWGKVPVKKITLLYPGVSPMEWILKGTEHGGAKAYKKAETCASCHDTEAADMGKKMASGEKIEPKPIKGKAPFIPVNVQAANDGSNLYLRFTWKQPPGGGPKMDAANPVKLAFMLDDNKVERSSQAGCWETCHNDARTMPDAKDDKKTKYIAGGNASSKFYDLIQWKSKEKAVDGYVADKRVMEGGKGLVEAKGEKKGDEWTVTFTRKLAGGGEGDVNLAAGKTYSFGFAIHDDHTNGRFHHVSLGYTLGIDAQADINAAKR
ncbi:ethylbenzene dehydrogenase-related protein [Denitratisoma oestradiolicum]|uniref:Cytochrome c-552 n=1 Tax=Denitratisoma oestradiolicum TaxID=311182 RepID=A0A6S6Y3X0_9PROT|nr:ethylbenzene dehydrogenase-related protein [Denitratisoma oestradiolicum]CAB1370107.1 Cytochrome c-552 [Denitratisoma oestradiolicum]